MFPKDRVKVSKSIHVRNVIFAKSAVTIDVSCVLTSKIANAKPLPKNKLLLSPRIHSSMGLALFAF